MAIDGRLLSIISSMNELGICTIIQLHRATGISRAAVYRIIDSLYSLGYVERINGQSTLRLTSKILGLSEGYKPDYFMAQKAQPILEKLQKHIHWPLAFATPAENEMIIQESTCSRNQFIFDDGHTGLRLPFLSTAIGCAYLSHCMEEERDAIFDRILQSDMGSNSNEGIVCSARVRIANAAAKGFAIRSGGEPIRTTSLAVPVMTYSTAIGALCTSFPTRAVSIEDACSRYVPQLQEAAKDIATALESREVLTHDQWSVVNLDPEQLTCIASG